MKLSQINRTTLAMALLTGASIGLTLWRFPDKVSDISGVLGIIWLFWLGVNLGEAIEKTRQEKLVTSSNVKGESE